MNPFPTATLECAETAAVSRETAAVSRVGASLGLHTAIS